MADESYFDRILGFLKSTNPKTSGVYLFTVGRPTWPETEGVPATVENDATQAVPVAWLGPQAPVADRPYMLHPCGNRYISGSGKPTVVKPPGATIQGCNCVDIPTTLYMIPNNTTYNGGMFKNCTLVWGPMDLELTTLRPPPNAFISTQSFIDQVGDTYWYYFTCSGENFTLTRIYKKSIFVPNRPSQDAIRFTWAMTAAGNKCDPFLLTNGVIYQGGDPRSQITITPTAP